MAEQKPAGFVDEVQVFDVATALQQRGHLQGRVDMATSPNSYIAVFQTAPRGGETHIHQHPDSDQILFVLQGQCTVEGLNGKQVLNPSQGVLIPAGVHYGFTNEGTEDLIFLSTRTEATGGRRVAYVPNVASDVDISIPLEEINAKGLGSHVYAYALDRRTIGVSPHLMEEWNKGSLLRMNCTYDLAGDHLVAHLPERLARWYRLADLMDGDYQLLTEPEKIRVRIDLTPLLNRETGS